MEPPRRRIVHSLLPESSLIPSAAPGTECAGAFIPSFSLSTIERIMKHHSHLAWIAALCLLLGPMTALAQDSPVGHWKTIDDETGEARSIVEIYEKDGELYGDIVEILKAREDAPRNEEGVIICEACDGDRHDKPVEGLNIIWEMEKDGDQWAGGRILDPENGKEYKAKMWLEDGNLMVRGFIGFSLIGRTQEWLPAEQDATGSEG
jgi:uncharacterized protein (DUF2147 family)